VAAAVIAAAVGALEVWERRGGRDDLWTLSEEALLMLTDTLDHLVNGKRR
jgi:hypothetical protein